MNEYQYHEFVAVDRALTERQQAEVRTLWSEADLDDTRLISTYHGGDVAGDPRLLVEKYFDAFLYLANWGTRRLMLRLPRRLLDLGTARRYCYAASAIASADDTHVILDLVSEDMGDMPADTDGDGLDGDAETDDRAEPSMASILPVREELASGDLRLLYLSWLLSVQSMEIDESAVEPPVPSNLRTLGPSLRALTGFLRIDDALVTVAARASLEPEPMSVPEAEMAPWLEKLPAAVKDAWLLRVARDEDPHVRGEVLRRYRTDCGVVTAAGPGERTAGELLDAADVLREERARLAAEQRAQDRERRERERALARERELEAVAAQQEYAWKRVGMLIETRKPNDYDQAVALLVDLREVSERNGSALDFDQRFQRVHHRHRKKSSLVERFRQAGLLPAGLSRPSA